MNAKAVQKVREKPEDVVKYGNSVTSVKKPLYFHVVLFLHLFLLCTITLGGCGTKEFYVRFLWWVFVFKMVPHNLQEGLRTSNTRAGCSFPWLAVEPWENTVLSTCYFCASHSSWGLIKNVIVCLYCSYVIIMSLRTMMKITFFMGL